MRNFAFLDLFNPPQIFVLQEAIALTHPKVSHPMIHQFRKLAMLDQKQLDRVLGIAYYTINYQRSLTFNPRHWYLSQSDFA